MNGKVLDFWQDHSLNYFEMAFRHDRRKSVTNPDGYGNLAGRTLYCAELAVGVFYLALANYQQFQRNHWKKPYQKG